MRNNGRACSQIVPVKNNLEALQQHEHEALSDS